MNGAGMQWVRLELRKAAVVRKEVDEAIKALETAVEVDNPEEYERIRKAFESRIEELEEFYLEHDDDERAVLFEKQRLRMRRTLQVTAGTMRSKNAARRQQQQQQLQQLQQAAVSTSATGAVDDVGEAGDDASPAKQTSRSPARHPPTSPARASTRKTAPARKPPPLYAWENQEQEQLQRTRIANDFGTYLPMEQLGFYKIAGINQESTEGTHIDMQIFLTEAEFQALLSRRRSFRAETKHSKRFVPAKQEESPYLMASTPYIDPMRVKQALYRPPQRDKWVTSQQPHTP